LIVLIAPHTYSDVPTPKFPLWRAIASAIGALSRHFDLNLSHT